MLLLHLAVPVRKLVVRLAPSAAQPAPCEQLPDSLKIRVVADYLKPTLTANLGCIEDASGPRGELAGFGTIRTELWCAAKDVYRFKCFLILPTQEGHFARCLCL